MPIVFRVAFVAGAAENGLLSYTVREQPLEAEITDSTCCLFWHVTQRAAQRGKLQTRI